MTDSGSAVPPPGPPPWQPGPNGGGNGAGTNGSHGAPAGWPGGPQAGPPAAPAGFPGGAPFPSVPGGAQPGPPTSTMMPGAAPTSPFPAPPPVAPAGPPAGGGAPPNSPWWAAGAANDPWRDPRAPAALIQSPDGPVGPPLDPLPAPPMPGPVGPRRGLGASLALTAVVALLVGALGGGIGYLVASRGASNGVLGPSYSDTPPAANRSPQSVAGVVKPVLPSVVTILIKTDNEEGNGSGFVISSDGYILTNNHVASAGTTGGSLKVVFSDNTTVAATVKGTDPEADLAVIKVDRTGLTPVKFGNSDNIAIGDPVIAIGTPLELQNTVTTGIVSALDRPVLTSKEGGGTAQSYMSAIQTDASINPGNSGGPLLDGAGHVIGVNTAIQTVPQSGGGGGGDAKSGSIGLGFSIPINQAKRIATDIMQTGKARRTVMGATPDNQSAGPDGGAKLTSVVPGGPADKAGLKSGDVITKFDGHPVSEPTDLAAFVQKDAPRSTVSVEYTRDGAKHTAQLTLDAA